MDWPSFGVQAIVALTSVLTSLVVFGIRKALPKIPKQVLPFLSLALGWGGTYLGALASGATNIPVIVGALAGAGAVFLYEAQKQVKSFLEGLK